MCNAVRAQSLQNLVVNDDALNTNLAINAPRSDKVEVKPQGSVKPQAKEAVISLIEGLQGLPQGYLTRMDLDLSQFLSERITKHKEEAFGKKSKSYEEEDEEEKKEKKKKKLVSGKCAKPDESVSRK